MQPKLLEIARIITQRMRAHITLIFEVLEKLCEMVVEHNVGTQAASLREFTFYGTWRTQTPTLRVLDRAELSQGSYEHSSRCWQSDLRLECIYQNTQRSKIARTHQVSCSLDLPYMISWNALLMREFVRLSASIGYEHGSALSPNEEEHILPHQTLIDYLRQSLQ